MEHISKPITGKYRHYKGNEYEVIGVGIHSESGEQMIVYKDTTPPHQIWVRPYDMFFETIVLNDKNLPRFERIEK